MTQRGFWRRRHRRRKVRNRRGEGRWFRRRSQRANRERWRRCGATSRAGSPKSLTSPTILEQNWTLPPCQIHRPATLSKPPPLAPPTPPLSTTNPSPFSLRLCYPTNQQPQHTATGVNPIGLLLYNLVMLKIKDTCQICVFIECNFHKLSVSIY